MVKWEIHGLDPFELEEDGEFGFINICPHSRLLNSENQTLIPLYLQTIAASPLENFLFDFISDLNTLSKNGEQIGAKRLTF